MKYSTEKYNTSAPNILGNVISSNGTELSTSKTQPTFKGQVPAQKTGIVVIWIDETKYTAPIQPDGSYTFTPPQALAKGLHNISIHAIKISGLIGDPVLFTLNVDTTAPDVPMIEFALDDEGSNTGAHLSNEKIDDRNPILRGNAEPGSIVNIYEGSVFLGSVKARANGSWEREISLSDGTHKLTATSTDKFGHTSAKSAEFVIEIGDDDAPRSGGSAAIINYAKDDVGSAIGKLHHGAITDDAEPELHGSAAAGSTVRIQYRSNNGKWIEGGNAVLNGTDWTWTPSPALSEGNWEFRANAGGGWSDEFRLEIDVTPSDQTRISHAWDDFGKDQGMLINGAQTDDLTPTLHGFAEANSEVYLHYRKVGGNWTLLDTITATADGSWEYQSGRFPVGVYEFKASNSLTGITQQPVFKLLLGDNVIPVIEHIYETKADVTNLISEGGGTDDRTPEF